MNLKGRYTVVGAVFATFIIVFFMPLDGQVGGRCKETCLDYSSLEKEINSLQAIQRDLVVIKSEEIGNKSFEELRLGKLKQIIRDQKKIQMALLDKQDGKVLGNKNWVLDCVTWNPLRQKNTHKQFWKTNNTESELRSSSQVKSQKEQESIYVSEVRKQGTKSSGTLSMGKVGIDSHSQRLMATLHVVITKIKQHLNKNTISILDVYCGNLTWMATFLKTRNDIHYTCVDNTQKVISNNKKLYKGVLPLAEFYFFDSFKSPIWEKFDLVLLFSVLEWIDSDYALKLLNHVSLSDSSYMLISITHSNISNDPQAFKKHPAGYFQHNLEIAPFLLDSPICFNSDQLKQNSVILWSLPLRINFP